MPEVTVVPPSTAAWIFNIVAGGLLAIAAWGVYRFIDLTDKRFDTGDGRMDDLDTKIERTKTRLTRLETEHRLRHGGEPLHEHHRAEDEFHPHHRAADKTGD